MSGPPRMKLSQLEGRLGRIAQELESLAQTRVARTGSVISLVHIAADRLRDAQRELLERKQWEARP